MSDVIFAVTIAWCVTLGLIGVYLLGASATPSGYFDYPQAMEVCDTILDRGLVAPEWYLDCIELTRWTEAP
jgi:hypothetical protein